MTMMVEIKDSEEQKHNELVQHSPHFEGEANGPVPSGYDMINIPLFDIPSAPFPQFETGGMMQGPPEGTKFPGRMKLSNE